MLSNPPVTTILLWFNKILYAPKVVAFKPDAHTLSILKQGMEWDNLAPRETYLAGFCPNPVDNTFPRITSSGSTLNFPIKFVKGKVASWGPVSGES